MKNKEKNEKPGRRKFLGTVGGVTAAALVSNAAGLPAMVGLGGETTAQAAEIGPLKGNQRRNAARKLRIDMAQDQSHIPLPAHPCNGDEDLYPNRIGNFTKNLKHDSFTGEVIPSAYNAYLAALNTGTFAAIESLATNGHFGCPTPAMQRRLVNPLCGQAFETEGADSRALAMRAAPAFASAEEAGEMVELYWMSLLRDVPFDQYATNATALAAANDLSNMSDFRGPKQSGVVTPQTLFRDTYPGCTNGPYISQFLLKPVGFGSQRIDTRTQEVAAGVNYMTTFNSWLDVQNGCNTPPLGGTGNFFFCRNGRDLGQYVHIDALYQAYFVAALHLLGGTGVGYPANPSNPYGRVIDGGAGRPLNTLLDPNGAKAQTGFGTLGAPDFLTLVTEPATRALHAIWYNKWFVHRRLRPEEFGGRVEVERLGRANYPIHPDLTSVSNVLNQVFSLTGNYLLPIAFPEGSPNHTAYGSGHATVAGACVTMLKALFDENAPIVNPVVVDPTTNALVPYVGPTLTVGGELNKVCSNVGQGRNIAGVHWRTDATEANKLGEDVAIAMLRDLKRTYVEPIGGITFTKFDGTSITI